MDEKTIAYIMGTVDGFISQYGCHVVECPDGELSLTRPDGSVFGCIDGWGRVIVEGVILDGLGLVQRGDGWDILTILVSNKN